MEHRHIVCMGGVIAPQMHGPIASIQKPLATVLLARGPDGKDIPPFRLLTDYMIGTPAHIIDEMVNKMRNAFAAMDKAFRDHVDDKDFTDKVATFQADLAARPGVSSSGITLPYDGRHGDRFADQVLYALGELKDGQLVKAGPEVARRLASELLTYANACEEAR